MAQGIYGYSPNYCDGSGSSAPPGIGAIEMANRDIAALGSARIAALAQTLADPAKEGEQRPYFNDKGANALYMVADETYLFRCAYDLFDAAQLSNPNLVYAYHGPGITTAGNFPLAAISAKKQWDSWAKSERIGDAPGVELSKWDFSRLVSQSAAGAAYLAYRPLVIAANLKNVEIGAASSSLVGRAAWGTGQVGNGLFVIFYTLMGAVSALGWRQGNDFLKEVTEGADVKKLEAGDEQELLKVVKKLEGRLTGASMPSQADIVAYQEAVKVEGEGVKKMIEESGGKLEKLSDEQCQKVVLRTLLEKHKGDYSKVYQELVSEGHKFLKGNYIQAQRTEISRQASGHALELAEKAAGGEKLLSARLEAGDEGALEEAKSLVETVTQDTKFNIKLNKWVLFFCILGALGSIAFFVFTGGTPLIAAAALLVISALIMTAIDAYCLKQSLEGGQSGLHDTTMIKVSSAVGLVATVVTLVVTGLFTFGIVPIVVTSVLGVSWLATNAYAYKKITENNQKYEEEHPTLQSFKIALLSGANNEKVKEIFSHFDREQQEAIQRMRFRSISDTEFFEREALISAVQRVQDNIERVRKQKFEETEESLRPFVQAAAIA